MAIFSATDLTNRLSTQAYTRLFAKNGGSTVDTAFRDLLISEAESEVRMRTKAAFPDGFDAAGGTVDEAIKGAAVDICCFRAASRHASSGDAEAFAVAYKSAISFLDRLNRDAQARPVTSASGRANPRARTLNETDSSGAPTNEFVQTADKITSTGF